MTLAPSRRFEWERVVRRVRMTSATKLVALTAATYGGTGGQRIWPGVERLVAVTGLGRRTVMRALAELRDLGLVERVMVASRTGGKADEYRLTIPGDLEARVGMLTAAEQVPPETPGPPVDNPAADPVDNPGPGATTDTCPQGDQVPNETGAGATSDRGRCHQGHPKGSPKGSPKHPATNDQGSVDHRADVEGAHALAVDNIPEPPSADPYPSAMAALQRLPDLGAALIAAAAQQLPAGASLREQVIAAADLTDPPP